MVALTVDFASIDSCCGDLTGDKSTNTKSFGLPGLFFGLLNGGLLAENLEPAAAILIELLKHSLVCSVGDDGDFLTLHNFLPLGGGKIVVLKS